MYEKFLTVNRVPQSELYFNSARALSACKKEIDMEAPGNLVPKTVDQDPTLPSISVNGTQLHAETFGNRDSAMVVVLTADRDRITEACQIVKT